MTILLFYKSEISVLPIGYVFFSTSKVQKNFAPFSFILVIWQFNTIFIHMFYSVIFMFLTLIFIVLGALIFSIYTNLILLSDSKWTQTYNHFALKQTLNHLAKLTYFFNNWAVLWVLKLNHLKNRPVWLNGWVFV